MHFEIGLFLWELQVISDTFTQSVFAEIFEQISVGMA